MSPCDAVTPAPVTVSRAKYPSAGRTKAYRRRRQRGARQVTIELTPEMVWMLEANGYLRGGRDSSKLAEAVELLISDHMPQSEP